MTANLELMHRGRLPLTRDITFPVQAEMDMEIGAITLLLDFDAANLLITGVEIPGRGHESPWYRVEGNTLYIGWMSLDAIRVARGESVLLIHGRMTGSQDNFPGFTEVPPLLRFTLNQNPLCELADANGEVIYLAKLAITDAGPINPDESEILVSIYPNPASDILFIEAFMPREGKFSAEMMSITGTSVRKMSDKILNTGMNKLTIDVRDLPNGAYLLRIHTDGQTRTMKVVVNK